MGARPRLGLRTDRLTLAPLGPEHADAHDSHECDLAHAHWQEHGFGSWAIFLDGEFAGVAELHFAHPGVTGISTDEIEAGWAVSPARQGNGLATEAMRAAIADLWSRVDADHLVAYVRTENGPSLRVAEKLGFTERSRGLTRSGDPMIVFELRR